MMKRVLDQAIHACNTYDLSFCKFISANDAGSTGTHQSGIYIPKNSFPILFENPGQRGSNMDRLIKIRWQDDFKTDSRFVYYGKGTRNEYRITRFGRGFPFLDDEYMGDLFILVKVTEDEYLGYILDNDEDIEAFLSAFNLSPASTNRLIDKTSSTQHTKSLEDLFEKYISGLEVEFPSTLEIATKSREFYYDSSGNKKDAIKNPDKELISWIEVEYKLFKFIEKDRYKSLISTPIGSVDKLVEVSNTILNRRKSRAGKSLEHHLSEIFTLNELLFTGQCVTEGNKKPDFIFPGKESYDNSKFPEEKLVFLGAKTTCKDRWRQILNEADRIEHKHLFTLQQGISQNQLKEMYDNKVTLVVPKEYIHTFPKEYREKIMSLNEFIQFVKERDNK